MWNPCANVAPKQEIASVKVDQKKCSILSKAQRADIANKCPDQVFDSELKVIKPSQCRNCGECNRLAKQCGVDKLVDIEEAADRWLLDIESNGSWTGREIVALGAMALSRQLDAFKKSVQTIGGDS